MNLEAFAKTAGVTVVECGPGWGGKFGFKTADAPNSTICGYRSETAALNGWMKYTFGEQTAKALRKLLEPSKDRA